MRSTGVWTVMLLSILFVFALTGCASPQGSPRAADQSPLAAPAASATPAVTPGPTEPAAPTPTARTAAASPPPVTSPGARPGDAPAPFPPMQEDDPQTRTALGDAVRHLAGWLHVPASEIQVVCVQPAEVSFAAVKSCISSLELDEAMMQKTSSLPGKLIVLQAKGKTYGYYAVGESVFLCPVQM